MFEPFQLKHLKFKNRIVKAAYSSTTADVRGYVLDSAVYHYEAVARGGVGLFITESVAVDVNGMTGTPRMAIWDDSFISGQKKLADAVHSHGVPIIMQLQHAGPAYSKGQYGAWSVAEVEALEPRASSSLTREQLPGPRPNLPRGLTIEEIRHLVKQFTKAAERAAAADYDGIELHGATAYLVNSFFSRAWNKRTDEYGGSIENRCRFATEIVKSIRASLGDKFVIAVRFNAAEFGTRHGDGISLEEGQRIGQILEAAGADLLNVTVMGYNNLEWMLFPEQLLYPEAGKGMEALVKGVHRNVPLVFGAEFVKKGVSIPVIAVGKLNFESAEKMLRKGKADFAAFARALISDPDAPNKLHEGRLLDIRPCTHCMTCVDAFVRSAHERCRVNAAYGQEREMQIIPAESKKRVLVIGGGPAGMEAARVAALRGHSVTLCERHSKLGGLVPLASLIKSTEIENLPAFIAYLEHQLKMLGVRVRRGTAVSAEFVRHLAPDAVIVASGSKLRLPEIPGLDKKIVMTSADLHKRVRLPMRLVGSSVLESATKIWMPVGKRVVLIGGLMQGVELAEFLIKRARQVVVTETAEQLGTGILEIHRTRVLEWLRDSGVTLLANVRYEGITEEGVELITRDGTRRFFGADSVIVLGVREPDDALCEELRRMVPAVYAIGDCHEPGMIVDAVEAGHRVACSI